MNITPLMLATSLEAELNGPRYDSPSRALLYATTKRESAVRDECVSVLLQQEGVASARSELPLTSGQVARWNSALTSKGYFDGSGGLKAAKQRGRVDAASFGSGGDVRSLVEVKFWSATDAVDPSRYLPGKTYNHSLLKSLEIDALKLRSAAPSSAVDKLIVTALFTIHCDGLSDDRMRAIGLAYVPLLAAQNRDRFGVGDSFAYRRAGVEKVMTEFRSFLGRGANADVVHLPVFGSDTAAYKGVGVSLDLVVAGLE